MIPKPGKKNKRPLTIGNPRDKIIQEAMRGILAAIYEPKFLDCSYGFREGRGAHDALRTIKQWKDSS